MAHILLMLLAFWLGWKAADWIIADVSKHKSRKK